MEKRIISALIGLAGACNNGGKTENTDSLLIKALAFSSSNSDSCTAIEELIGEIRKEKNIISPGCALCTAPCGNTSDYDMSRLETVSEEVRGVKLQILTELHRIAKDTPSLSENDTELLYKSLSYVSYDLEKEPLQWVLRDLQAIK